LMDARQRIEKWRGHYPILFWYDKQEPAYFEYCAQLNPANAGLFQYLGGTYHALGRTDEAVGAYQKALKLDPSNEELKNTTLENLPTQNSLSLLN